MLHAGKTAPLRDRLVERVISRWRPELQDVLRSEMADDLWRQRDFAHRLHGEFSLLARCALRGRIERADRFKRIAEEIEAKRLVRTWCKEIENATTYRIFANVTDSWHALKSIAFKTLNEYIHVNSIAGLWP